MNEERVTGWWLFAGIILLISGTLNIIWGIAAIDESHFFALNTHYILSNLNTWGLITLGLGLLEILAGFSLFGGGGFGRWFGIFAAGLVAIDSLFNLPAYPFWSLCVFALSVIVLYQLAKPTPREVERSL